MVAGWQAANAAAEYVVDTADYINERGLEIIRVAEGHNGYDPKEKTTHYGITQAGIDGLAQLPIKYNVKTPQWMIGAKAEDLTKAQAKEVAAYNGVLNTMLVDDFSECENFSNMDIDDRSMFLTYLHNVSPYSLRAGYAEKAPGSFLQAVRTGNKYAMGLAMISKADGTPIDEVTASKTPGYTRRALIPLFAMGDRSFTFTEEQERELDNRFRQPGFTAETHSRLQAISEDWFLSRKELYDEGQKRLRGEFDEEPAEETSPTQEPTPEADETKGLLRAISDFTDKVKKLFTKEEEVQQNAQGNTDVNMQ